MRKTVKKRKNKPEKKDILKFINSDDALSILKTFMEENEDNARRIEQIVHEYLSGLDVEKIAIEVQDELGSIYMGEVYDRSGSKSDGYMDPADMEMQIFEERLEPFLEKMQQYQELDMNVEAQQCCKGILLGIHCYDTAVDPENEYKTSAADVPGECFGWILSEWKDNCKNQKEIKEMERFAKEKCS